MNRLAFLRLCAGSLAGVLVSDALLEALDRAQPRKLYVPGGFNHSLTLDQHDRLWGISSATYPNWSVGGPVAVLRNQRPIATGTILKVEGSTLTVYWTSLLTPTPSDRIVLANARA